MGYCSFYDVFTKIKDNNVNYIDYLVWEEFDYCVCKKTFHEIYSDTINCYNNLLNYGITATSVVGIDIENSYEFLICDSALLLLGSQSIISNNTEKKELLKERLDNFKADYVITKRELGDISQFKIDVSSLLNKNNSVKEVILQQYKDKDISIMFSSGTTGIPKALGITEQGSIWSANNFFNYMQFKSDDKFLIFMPLANYQQRFLFWGCLMNNVNISLGSDMTLFHALKRLEATILLAPPNFYYNIYYQQINEGKEKNDVLISTLGSKMNYLLTGMAPIDNHILEFYRDSGMEIYQIYGQTEIGMLICNNKVLNKLGSVGQPIIELYLSEDKEVITHSPYPIVSGYYTEDGFIDLGEVRPTGDLGEEDEEGFIYIKGRLNETIILNNGKKINPASIEHEIKSKQKIQDVVLYKTQTDEEKFILNIVILNDNFENIDISELKKFIMSLQEIKACTDDIKISTYKIKEEDKKTLYTENGKFARAKAIKLFAGK